MTMPDFREASGDIFFLNQNQVLLFSKQEGFDNPIPLISNPEHEKVKE